MGPKNTEFITKTLANLSQFSIYLHQLFHLKKKGKNYYTSL